MRTAATMMSVAAVMAFSGYATAAEEQATTQKSNSEAIDIVSWDHTNLYDGWRVEEMMDTTVIGANGEEIGEVENLIVSRDGNLEAVVIEAGGFADIGDTHFRVRWDDVEVGDGMDALHVPMTEDSAPTDFSLFEDEEVRAGGDEWRATELLDDYVQLKDNRAYGIVDDLIFDRDGQLMAVIVSPDVRYGVTGGRYAYPYSRYDAGRPGNVYTVPYGSEDIQNLAPFDYSRMNDDVFSDRSG